MIHNAIRSFEMDREIGIVADFAFDPGLKPLVPDGLRGDEWDGGLSIVPIRFDSEFVHGILGLDTKSNLAYIFGHRRYLTPHPGYPLIHLKSTILVTFFVLATQIQAQSNTVAALRKFQGILKKAHILQPPQVPVNCLQWSVATAGPDTLRMTARSQTSKRCERTREEMDWLVPRSGGEPVLALGDQDPIRLTLPEAEIYLSRDAFHSTSVLSAGAKSNTSRSRTCRTLDTVVRTTRIYLGGFRYTYEMHLKEEPNLGDWIYQKLLILPSGKISHAFIESSVTGSAELDEKLRIRAEKMEFPAVPGCYTAYTFRLELSRR